MTTATAHFLCIPPLICICLMLAASLHDIVARTVPDHLVMVVSVAGMATGWLNGHLVESLLVAGGVLLLAILCWRRGWVGGGDVKLVSAACVGIPGTSVLIFLAAVALAGGVLAVLYLSAKCLMPVRVSKRPANLFARVVRVERWRLSRGGPLPYACAITAGFLFVIV